MGVSGAIAEFLLIAGLACLTILPFLAAAQG